MASLAPTLPAEIQSEIMQYCTPTILASLACVGTCYQLQAERLLYSKIAVTRVSYLDVFKSILSSPRRARYVNSLSVKENSSYTEKADVLAEALIPLLPKLVSLRDLRLRFHVNGKPEAIETLGEILSREHFNLHTLFCNDWFDLPCIINKHPQLQFLAIYKGDFPPYTSLMSSSQPGSETSCRVRPAILRLGGEHYDSISISPSDVSQLRYQTFCQELQRTLDDGSDVSSNAITYIDMCLQGIDDQDHATEMTTNIGEHFPNVNRLHLLVEPPCTLKLADIKRLISPVRNLQRLNFTASRRSRNCDLDLKAKLAYAREWNETCKGLNYIGFADEVYLERKGPESEWCQKRF